MLYPTWTDLLSLPLTLNRHEAPAFNNSSQRHICPQKKSTCIGIYGALCFILTWKTKGLTTVQPTSIFHHNNEKTKQKQAAWLRIILQRSRIVKSSRKQSQCSPSPQVQSTLMQHITPGQPNASAQPFKKSPDKIKVSQGSVHLFNSWEGIGEWRTKNILYFLYACIYRVAAVISF